MADRVFYSSNLEVGKVINKTTMAFCQSLGFAVSTCYYYYILYLFFFEFAKIQIIFEIIHNAAHF